MDPNAAGKAAFAAGRYAEAVSLFGEALERTPADHLLLCNRSAAQLKLGRYDAAVQDARRATDAAPSFVKAHYRLACALQGRGDVEEALRSVDAALLLEPTHRELRGLRDAWASAAPEEDRVGADDAPRKRPRRAAEDGWDCWQGRLRYDSARRLLSWSGCWAAGKHPSEAVLRRDGQTFELSAVVSLPEPALQAAPTGAASALGGALGRWRGEYCLEQGGTRRDQEHSFLFWSSAAAAGRTLACARGSTGARRFVAVGELLGDGGTLRLTMARRYVPLTHPHASAKLKELRAAVEAAMDGADVGPHQAPWWLALEGDLPPSALVAT